MEHSEYHGKSDHDLLVELCVRTEGLESYKKDTETLKRDRWWLFSLIGGAWAFLLMIGAKFL